MALFYRRLPKFEYIKTSSVGETLSLLSAHKGARLLAGGTDLVPQLRRRQMVQPGLVIDLKGIPDLDTIRYDEKDGLTIGCLATISAIGDSPVVARHFPILRQTALSMASPQVRNRGTFAGNICNAASSADSAPALLALGALVKLKGQYGERAIPIDQFFTGPGRTVLAQDEMVTGISVPVPDGESRGVYIKLSPRHSMDLAVVGVAAVGAAVDGLCKDVKIAFGAVAPTPIRAPSAEETLKGLRLTPELIDEAARNGVAHCSPRKDSHRATSEYRRDMVYVLTRRALNEVFGIRG